MLNIKIWVFVISLAIAGVVGALGTKIIINSNVPNCFQPNTKADDAFMRKFHSAKIINTGRNKEY